MLMRRRPSAEAIKVVAPLRTATQLKRSDAISTAARRSASTREIGMSSNLDISPGWGVMTRLPSKAFHHSGSCETRVKPSASITAVRPFQMS